MDSIASLSMCMSQANISANVSISVLKGAMEQSSEQMMEIVDSLAPLIESTIDISI